ncbi:MAG TPA: SWIM zinc finger family protein [Anaerolineae bacterium]|nr:SWIM zinc finger family protein [Anaerolineae bacterium]
MLREMTVSNRAHDLAAFMPIVRRAMRGLVDVRAGGYVVEETIPGTFRVVNAHTGRDYAVQYYERAGIWTCDCPDFRHRHLPLCKHIVMVWSSGLVNDEGVPRSCEPPF